MPKKMICAGNWKLNKGPKETKEFVAELKNAIPAEQISNFVLFVSPTNLQTLQNEWPEFSFGPQNIFWEDSGAFTGETSANVAKELGCSMALVGHSERRQIFSETNEQTAKKMKLASSHGLVPVICVGETLEQREAGETSQVICEQLEEALEGWNPNSKLWVAYEPVWAIGTGKVATPEQAEDAHKVLRKSLSSILGEEQSKSVPILYGGSVKPENAGELSLKENIDGFLIGGASLKVESFVGIFNESNQS